MDVKSRIAFAGMECLSGWAGEEARWYDYLGAAVMLAPFAYELSLL